ncbi:hydroxyisourate hydrolase [Streptomyces sp. NPDC005438]|uniref:hydroxyisourate hydrolase n=1 Tax=Streptomyces sp. NPDC005438 TaxID=3156880 RepID=UPI0033A5843B
MSEEPTGEPTTVSTHILDTSRGRPAAGVTVRLETRPDPDQPWSRLASGETNQDGRCAGLPPLPAGTTHARLSFETATHLSGAGTPFFPEVTVAFAVDPGEHYHVPLLLNPYGYSVYRGS